MMKKSVIPESVDEYIASASPPVRPLLRKIRRAIKAAVPGATEVISYRMPALRLRRTFFYFAAFKNHIGVYPPVKADAKLMKALAPYSNEKGNLKFPLGDAVPYELIARVAAALARQYRD